MAVPRSKPMASWPADKVERRPIGTLLPYARNARTHSEAQVDQLAASIREWGWTTPVLVTDGGTIIAGHGRVRAAKKLGLTDVPVMVANGWTKAQIQAYALADNKLALNAGWDDQLLAIEIGELQEIGFDIDLLGFSEAEIAAIGSHENAGLTDPDDVPEVPANPVSRPGDLWLLGRHRLLCGDSTVAADVEKVLGSVKPHLMVTDPPYGVDYDPAWRARAGINKSKSKLGRVTNDDRSDWREAWQLFLGDVAYVWSAPGPLQVSSFESLIASGFQVRQQIIWAKDRFALGRGHYHYQHEPCWYAVRSKGHWASDRSQTSLWQIPARDDSGHGHGTQKPVECMKRPIENNSSPGQAIYEPFSGSGTTIIAAEITGRSCHAIELMPQYVDVAIERWQAFTGDAARLEDGRTFGKMAAERRAASVEA